MYEVVMFLCFEASSANPFCLVWFGWWEMLVLEAEVTVCRHVDILLPVLEAKCQMTPERCGLCGMALGGVE